jgi:hypothetical protein
MNQNEIPIKSDEARKRLGVGRSFFSAVKRAMGLKHRRRVMLSQIQEWWAKNSDFQESDVYHRRDCVCEECALKRTNPNRRERGSERLVQQVDAGG